MPNALLAALRPVASPIASYSELAAVLSLNVIIFVASVRSAAVSWLPSCWCFHNRDARMSTLTILAVWNGTVSLYTTSAPVARSSTPTAAYFPLADNRVASDARSFASGVGGVVAVGELDAVGFGEPLATGRAPSAECR